MTWEKNQWKWMLPLLAFLIALNACHRNRQRHAGKAAAETAVQQLEFEGKLLDPAAEVSGMAWYGDTLIILPQYPAFPDWGGGGHVYALFKSEILAYLDSPSPAPLSPRPIPFDAPDLNDVIDHEGIQGYEAIVFSPDTKSGRAWLTIETEPREGAVVCYVVRAKMAPGLAKLEVETEKMARIPGQSGITNKGEESLFLVSEGHEVVAIHEANGVEGGAAMSHVTIMSEGLNINAHAPFPHIPYRITDATELDAAGRFWVINYLYPESGSMHVTTDSIVERWGQGAKHRRYEHVERLLEIEYSPKGILLTDTPPIQLKLQKAPINWEAIVRLEGRGFLLMNDKFGGPTTILGFVPHPSR